MRIDMLVQSLAIFGKYYEVPGGDHIQGEHDLIHLYPTDHPMTSADVEKVKSLGWFQPYSKEKYEPSDGWSNFT